MKTYLPCILLVPFAALIGFTFTQKEELFSWHEAEKLNLTKHNLSYKNVNFTRRNLEMPSKTLLFKDYIMKFNPNLVYNRIIDEKTRKGMNSNIVENFEDIFAGKDVGFEDARGVDKIREWGMDITDELLNFKVEAVSGRRKWTPTGDLNREASRNRDLFSLRMRLYDLIKHAIYQTRNRIIPMQVLREKYKNSSLYKMGFLMSRTDFACKDFHSFSYKALHACPNRWEDNNDRYEVISMMHSDERIINKWFEVELLVDLIHVNDKAARKAIHAISGRKESFKFTN